METCQSNPGHIVGNFVLKVLKPLDLVYSHTSIIERYIRLFPFIPHPESGKVLFTPVRRHIAAYCSDRFNGKRIDSRVPQRGLVWYIMARPS